MSQGVGTTIHSSQKNEAGFSVVELIVALAVLATIATAVLGFYAMLTQTTFVAKRRAVASDLATNQMEYLKSLPYNSLAVVGGSIVATSPLPAYFNTTVNGVVYTVRTNINYIDDAYDGCRFLTACQNQPVPAGAPSNDLNPADYKSVHVSVYSATGIKLAEVDTKVSAKVAETSSNTGALLVRVLDPSGNPISGATVTVTNSTLVPTVSVADSTDANGTALFYDLPPDSTGYDYVINATYSNYSSLTTIPPTGVLQATYPSQQILTQQSSVATMTLKPQGQFSVVGEVVNTSGTALANAKIYAKGGYKKYTATTDTTYYFDNVSPSDTRPTSDASGIFTITNLVPGPYYFCGDSGATSCTIGATTYYLAAAVPYSGTTTFNPITVPTYLASSPPATTFPFGGNNYLQKVRLILTTSSSFPRISTMTPTQESLAGGTLNNFSFQITGVNLPCSLTASSCSTTVKFTQGSDTYTASCTGNSGLALNCTVDLTGISTGNTQMIVSSSGNTLTLPAAPLLGGLVITP